MISLFLVSIMITITKKTIRGLFYVLGVFFFAAFIVIILAIQAFWQSPYFLMSVKNFDLVYQSYIHTKTNKDSLHHFLKTVSSNNIPIMQYLNFWESDILTMHRVIIAKQKSGFVLGVEWLGDTEIIPSNLTHSIINPSEENNLWSYHEIENNGVFSWFATDKKSLTEIYNHKINWLDVLNFKFLLSIPGRIHHSSQMSISSRLLSSAYTSAESADMKQILPSTESIDKSNSSVIFTGYPLKKRSLLANV